MIHAFIKKGCFQDSVSLMIISRKLSESENVDDVSVMMGTPANKALLDTTGFWHDDFNNATPNDICVAIRSEAADAGIAQAIMQQLEEALKQLAQGSGSSQALTQVRRWDSACQKLPDASLALISVAGEYAAELANQALDRNLNVMMFSDNVTLEDEIQLKSRAREKGLLVMGPDCGTSMIAGTPLAFANVMPEGNIGVIGASGIGGAAMIAAPGVTRFVGAGGMEAARAVPEEMAEIYLERNMQLQIPGWDFQGACLGLDIRRVVETGITPLINTGIAHKEAGIGQIGAGTVRAPLACFEQALEALAESMGIG